ncbi:MAG TPA: hypothetical protein GXZ43_04980 [Clostridiaceae bacterium]|nr:hypothetical protein [Clostridiaceae bacterium]
MLKKYKFGLDVWSLVLFLLIMIPNFIWASIPAPNDILRAESISKTIDLATFIFRILMIATLCCLKNNETQRISLTPLIVFTGISCLLYYFSWFAYYQGLVDTIVILGLSVTPCLSFLLYAIDRKNLIAIIPILLFTVGHLTYTIVNFIIY